MEVIFIRDKIYEIRGQRVMLDFDLAALYEVPTKVLNQAVKRNAERFPEDFMFRLTEEEWVRMWSQIVITSGKGQTNIQILDGQSNTKKRTDCKE
ncbi:MAG: ORF6N domain-containing protein [Chitinophagaceae bacterium]|nr:ORF6N domain-containing protein [Chitinophagaceae bacterium]